MSKLKLSLLPRLLFSSCILLLIDGNLLVEAGHNPFHQVEILDSEGKYRVEWETDWKLKQVHFHIGVETHGFVAFGLSKDKLGSKSDQFSDIVIGGVDPNGTVYFDDRYAIGNRIPVVDDKQDWILRSAWESQTHTFLNFSRHFDTEDLQDLPINDNTVYMIWAYGETDDIADFSLSTRGSSPMYMLDPDLTPWSVQEKRGANIIEDNVLREDVKVWSVERNFHIPTKRTTYWCRIHKINFSKKHHIIGYTMNVNKEAKPNVHHMTMIRCTLQNPGSLYEKFISHTGEECYNQQDQLGEIPFQSCLEITAGFAIGGRSHFFPKEMGISIGGSGQPEYYLFQIHYNNPEGRIDLRSQVRLDIYYTDKLRKHDGGLLSIGHNVPASPSILIPPSSTDHKIHGGCSPTCSRRLLPPEGIKIVGALLHAHNAGRRMTIRHFRNDRELPTILDDQNWQFDFQPLRRLRDVATVLPGDEVKIECHYDTARSNQSVVGGWGADQEMCKIFALYYNHLPDYNCCRSELVSLDYMSRYLAGTRRVTWNQSKLEFVSSDPQLKAGMTLSEISDSHFVNWSAEQRTMLQNDHNDIPQIDVCPTLLEMQGQART